MKNSYTATLVLLISSLLFSFSTAYAKGNWYGGIGYGNTSTDTGVIAGTATLDEDDTGLKLFVGKQLDKNVSIEAMYADLGEASLTGDNGDTFTYGGVAYQFIVNNASIKYEGNLIGISGVFSHRVAQNVSFHGKIGLTSWEVDATVSGSGIGSSSASSDGTDLFYGLGIDYRITDGWSVRGEYEIFNFEDDDADMLSASIIRWF